MMNTQPNILWICTDQQRFDTIAALGNTKIRTPNIDTLVKTGVSFTNTFCQCPVCTPSRGRDDPDHHRSTVYCEYFNAMTEHRNPLPYLVSVRDEHSKIIVYAGLEEGELYDLEKDPNEHHNLWNAAAHGNTRQRYLHKCLERRMFTADPLPRRVADF